MMLITFGIHLYEKCTKIVFPICLVYFQNCAAIRKSHYGFKAYPCPNIKKVVFLKFNAKKKWQNYFDPLPQFLKVGREIAPQLFRP